jgi:hypothetical protein
MVVCDVIGASSDFKVLKPVVVLDSVDVVDVLVAVERASKMALHDVAMLKHVEAAACELDVSVFADSASNESIAALARAEAHVASGCPAWLDVELSAARFAGETDSHSSAPIRWWRSDTSCHNGTSLKGLRAHMTGSWEGLRAVPQPSHWRAASVAGAVMSRTMSTSAPRIPPLLPLRS